MKQSFLKYKNRPEKYWILRLFFLLFAVTVSVAVLPCGIINVHGLFGEVITATVIEDKEEISNIKSDSHEKVQNVKGVNIFCVWFEILIVVLCIRFWANLVKLPREDTIVTLKVRMDN